MYSKSQQVTKIFGMFSSIKKYSERENTQMDV